MGGALLSERYCPVGPGVCSALARAALWTFDESVSFEEGCLLAMNLGDDADTTAAAYGQLAGAFYGEEEIPERCYRSWRIAVSSKTSPKSSLTPVPCRVVPSW